MKRIKFVIQIALIFYSISYAEWLPEVRISESASSYDTQLIIVNDTLHVIYSDITDGDKIRYIRGTEKGDYWTASQIISDTAVTNGTTSPQIIANDSLLIAFWRNLFNTGYYYANIGYSVSYDRGTSWSEPSYALFPNWRNFSKVAVSANDSLINIIFFGEIDNQISCYIIKSDWSLSNWSEPEIMFTDIVTGISSAAMQAYGNTIHFVWYGRLIEQISEEVYYTRSIDNGFTWSSNIALSALDDEFSRWPSLTINERGDIAVCWVDYKYSSDIFYGDISIRTSNDYGESWNDEQELTYDDASSDNDVFWYFDTINVVRRYGSLIIKDVGFLHSVDNGESWSDEIRLNNYSNEIFEPKVAYMNGVSYVIWADHRWDPDNDIYNGIYFTRSDGDVSIDSDVRVPLKLETLYSYPNPFNSTTVIKYQNIEGGEIEIYDITGRLVKTFISENYNGGSITWDGNNEYGEKITSGMYILKAKTGDGFIKSKLIFVK